MNGCSLKVTGKRNIGSPRFADGRFSDTRVKSHQLARQTVERINEDSYDTLMPESIECHCTLQSGPCTLIDT